MGSTNSAAPAGQVQPASLGDAFQRLAGTATIRIGGTSARNLQRILIDAQRHYQGWLNDQLASDCQREVAALRLIVIEDVLDQLGHLPVAGEGSA